MIEQKDRGLRDLTIAIAKKLLDMELTEEEELMLGAAYKIGFADAMYLFIDGDDRDESTIEEGSR